MEKKEYEESIIKLTKEILLPDGQKEFLINLKKQDLAKNKKENYNAKEIVENNFLENFLIPIPVKEDKILVLGINPGGGDGAKYQSIKGNCLLAIDFKYDKEITAEEKELYLLLNDKYIWQKYYYTNFKLFSNLKKEGKLFWSYSEEYAKDIFRKILDKEKENIQNKQNLNKIFDKLLTKEMKKNGPYIIFNDLFCYADGRQNNIKKILKHYESKNKRNKLEIIRDIIDKYIEYYQPKMVVVTNAYASDLISNSLNNLKNCEINEEDYMKYKDIDIILSGMVTGGNMDKYSYYRLKKRISEVYQNECN